MRSTSEIKTRKFIAIITDSDIRSRFDEAAAELEEEKQIRFPGIEARAEFIEDCVLTETDKYELYGCDPFSHSLKHCCCSRYG